MTRKFANKGSSGARRGFPAKRSDRIASSIEAESIIAGAAGVAALGSVIGMALASGLVAPLVGTVIGAASGGTLGHLANAFIQRRRDSEQSRPTAPMP